MPEPTKNTPYLSERPPRLSPLHATHQQLGASFVGRAGWEVPQAYTSAAAEATAIREQVGLVDLSSLGKLLVRGEAAADVLRGSFSVSSVDTGHVVGFATEDQTQSAPDTGYLARLTADEFLLITSPGAEGAAARQIKEGHTARGLFLTVEDQTSGLAGLAVVGPSGCEVLSKLCAFSLGLRDFPNHRVVQSSLAKVHSIIVRNDIGALPAYELYFERPYAGYLWHSITDAGTQYGLIPMGWAALTDIETRFL